MLLVMQAGVESGWVGTTVAISLVIIALSFITIAIAMAVALGRASSELRQLSEVVDSLRADLAPALKAVSAVSGEGERLASLVSTEAEEVVRASQALRQSIRHRLTNLEAVYDVLAEEVEETALDAAVTLRTFRTGTSWFSLIRRLLRLGRGR